MRILTAKQFLEEPCGTVYIQYIPHVFVGQPKIKCELRGGENSWWATDVLPWIEGETDSEIDTHFNKQKQCRDYELPTCEFCTDDAIYNHDSDVLYAVFNKDEVKDMIVRLTKTL